MTSHDTDGLEGDVKTHEKERIVFHDNMKMQNMNNMNMDTMKMNMDAHGSMGSMEHMDMMMGPHWLSNYTKGPFLFVHWLTNTISGLIAALLLSVVLAMIFECMSYAFNVYHLRAERWHTRQNRVVAHVLLSLLKTLSVGVAYIIMLCAMSYNIWILMAIVVGAGVGHLLGRPLMSSLLKKEKKRVPDQTTKELLHDFPDEYFGTNKNRQTVANSRNFSSFEEKLLKYKYDET